MTMPLTHWPTDRALALLHGPHRCPVCGARGWVGAAPLTNGEVVHLRCPACTPTRRWLI